MLWWDRSQVLREQLWSHFCSPKTCISIVTVISMEIEDLKLKRRHHQILYRTEGWFKGSTFELTFWWSSCLDPSVCADVKDKPDGFLTCCTFLREMLPCALAHRQPQYFLHNSDLNKRYLFFECHICRISLCSCAAAGRAGALSDVSFGIDLWSFKKCWELEAPSCDGAASYVLLLASLYPIN